MSDESMNSLWKAEDKLRGSAPRDLAAHLAALQKEGVEITPACLSYLLQRSLRESGGYFPVRVAEFISDLIAPHAPKAVLDPWGGMGILPAVLSKRLAPAKFDVLTANAREQMIIEMLDPEGVLNCRVCDPLGELSEMTSRYDAVVSCPPFGGHLTHARCVDADGVPQEFRGERGHLALLLACLRLDGAGVAACVVAPNFLSRSRRTGAARMLEEHGLRVRACIELPAGTFHPFTSMQTNLLIIERREGGRLFCAQYSADAKHQSTVRDNLTNWTEGERTVQGCLVDAAEFRGFAALAAAERVRNLAKRMHAKLTSFGAMVLEVNRPRAGKSFIRFPETPNSVYLPVMAQTPATTAQDQLPDRLRSYLQVVLREDTANATFVAGLLNTNFGQAVRDVARTGAITSRIDHRELLKAPFVLPPLETQEDVVATRAQISRLQTDLSDLERLLWSRPTKVREVEAKLRSVNKGDRFLEWMETLPFPLASILWRYHAHKGPLREEYERLLVFFEALAEFVAIVHLSALSSNESLWAETRTKLKQKLDDRGLSFGLASFGMWKLCAELLGSTARTLLTKEPDMCFDLYRTHDRKFLEALFSKPLLGVLQETNAIRNSASGHVGAVGEATASRTLVLLTEQLRRVRDVFGASWSNYELVRPLECRRRRGVFHYDAQRIVGTRSMPFKPMKMELTEAMDDERLYLWNPAEARALELLPLIRIMASPQTEQTACYFYNRRQSEGIRFLSYHFEAEPEMVQSFSGTADALDLLEKDAPLGA